MFFRSRYILFLTLYVFLIKWIFIIYFNNNLNLISILLNNIDDWQYFTLVFELSNYNLSPTYDPNITTKNYIPFPIYSILYHSISIKLFSFYGLIVVEFLAIFLFFYILINFFKKIGLDFNLSVLISLIIFSLIYLIEIFNLGNIEYINAIKELYNLRIPRPSISNLYFFFFLSLIINIKNLDQLNNKRLFLIGILFSLMWGSFYYNLAISGVLFIIYYIYLSFRNSKINYFNIFKHYSILSISFLIFSVPLIYILIQTEPDYLKRVGLINLNFEKKEILINHFLSKIISIKFISIFILLTLLKFLINTKKIIDLKKINLLYFLFLSSFISPLLFILFSPTISEIYHFSNMIVALSFFVILIYSAIVFKIFIPKHSFFEKILPNISIILILSIYTYGNFLEYRDRSLNKSNKAFNEIVNYIDSIKLKKNLPILTFDGKIQTNLILKNYENLNIVLGINTSLPDEIIEDKLIDIFKYLNLDQENFYKFIENKKSGWRYINNNIGKTFYMKYQANSLKTFKDSMDFSDDELIYINKSSPLHSQQLIIPKFELSRLKNKFLKNNYLNLNEPKLIIINNNDRFAYNLKLNNKMFCKININQIYTVYINKTIDDKCT